MLSTVQGAGPANKFALKIVLICSQTKMAFYIPKFIQMPV